MANEQTKDLLSALDTFKQGVSEYSQFQAIDKANQAVQQVRASAEADAKKRASLQQIANDLVGQLALSGTPATTMQTLSEALSPKLPGSPEAAVLSGVLTGKPEEVQAGVQARRLIEEPREAARLRQAEATAQARAGAKGAKPISDAQINKIQELDDELGTGQDVLRRVKEKPSLVGIAMKSSALAAARELADPEFGAFKAQLGQWFDQYRVRITGAGASGSELNILQRNRPQVGDPAKLFQKKVEAILQVGEKVKQRRLSNLQKAGRDVSGFMDEAAQNREAMGAVPPTSPNRIIEVRQKSTGRVRRAEVDPSGKILRFVE